MARIIRVEANRLVLLSNNPRIKEAFRQVCFICQIDPDTGELPDKKNSKEFVDYFEDFVWCYADSPKDPLRLRETKEILREAKSLESKIKMSP